MASMYLSKDEIAFLRQTAKWFEENQGVVSMPKAMHTLNIPDKAKYEVLVKTMQELGAISDISGADDNHANAFMPSANAVQLCRAIDDEKNKQALPDVVDQIQARFRRNPAIAWTIVALVALTFLFTLANQAVELWSKMFPGKPHP